MYHPLGSAGGRYGSIYGIAAIKDDKDVARKSPQGGVDRAGENEAPRLVTTVLIVSSLAMSVNLKR